MSALVWRFAGPFPSSFKPSGILSPVRGDLMNQFEAAMCFTWTAKERTPL